MLSIAFALLSALRQALASLLQRMANVAEVDGDRSFVRKVISLVSRTLWLFGLLAMAGTLVFNAVALYLGQLAVVQPILVTELIFTLLLRKFWMKDSIEGRTWGAAVLLCAGLGTFLAVARPEDSSGSPSASQWIVALSFRIAVVAVLLVASRWGSPARRAALLGATAGMIWAVDAAFIKVTTDQLASSGVIGLFAHWPVYAAVISGVAGTVVLQAAFSAGPLSASQSALLIVDPLASITLGIELFGETLTRTPVAVLLEIAGLVIMVAGVVLLSLWAPPDEGSH